MKKIVIDPVTRIEGHLKVEVVLDDENVIREARSSGTLFRGFEIILKGRDPRDATQITQRICGVCPISHATASSFALDDAFGVKTKITDNARLLRNLILGSNFLQSHILHFYHLALLDYVDVADAVNNLDGRLASTFKEFIERSSGASPFLPRYEGDWRLPGRLNAKLMEHYVEALKMRMKSHELLALFGGKAPHNVGIVAGGVSLKPEADKILNFYWRLKEIEAFVEDIYMGDILELFKHYKDMFELGKGVGKFLAYGGFDLDNGDDYLLRDRFFKSGVLKEELNVSQLDKGKIAEYLKHSFYDEDTSGKHPSESQTVPLAGKPGAYSWIKSPRYDGEVCEVGPAARISINYVKGHADTKKALDEVMAFLGLKLRDMASVGGRHVCRALECKLLIKQMLKWVLELNPNEDVYIDYEVLDTACGYGFTEAPRGALLHYVKIEGRRIENYQCVVPTTWNASPKDDAGQPGPIEQALLGVKVRDPDNPFEVVRIVRSFDPCLACAVHLVDLKGNTLNEVKAT